MKCRVYRTGCLCLHGTAVVVGPAYRLRPSNVATTKATTTNRHRPIHPRRHAVTELIQLTGCGNTTSGARALDTHYRRRMGATPSAAK